MVLACRRFNNNQPSVNALSKQTRFSLALLSLVTPYTGHISLGPPNALAPICDGIHSPKNKSEITTNAAAYHSDNHVMSDTIYRKCNSNVSIVEFILY